MPIAAVPRYLANQDFSTASPALRFGMYLRLWGIDSRSRECLWTTHDVNYRTAGRDRVERAFKDENKTSALRESARISDGDRRMLDGLSSRQTTLAALAACSNPVFTLDALRACELFGHARRGGCEWVCDRRGGQMIYSA